jgi:hypothetical protein
MMRERPLAVRSLAGALLMMAIAALLLAPAVAADDQLVGAGMFDGTVNYTAGVPAEPGCSVAAFSVSLGSQNAIVDFGGLVYAGPIFLAGSGASTGCASVVLDTGNITFAASGSSVTGDISCPSLAAVYLRVAAVDEITVSGTCTITMNGQSGSGTGVFALEAIFRPIAGNGVTSTITQAELSGVYVT